MKSALGIDKKNTQKSIMDTIESFSDGEAPYLRIGFEKLSYDFAIREVIVDFIATQLLRKARTCSFRQKPILLFIDEAHQFLNKKISADDDTSFYLQGIELIAKEARNMVYSYVFQLKCREIFR